MDDSLKKKVLAEWRRQQPDNTTYTNNQTTKLTLDEVNLWIELLTTDNQDSWGYLPRYGYRVIDNRLLMLLSVGS